MRTYRSSSTVLPEAWDVTSSPTTVYHNYDVSPTTGDDDEPQMYEYTVDEYTREEYNRDQPQLLELRKEAEDMKAALALLGVSVDE